MWQLIAAEQHEQLVAEHGATLLIHGTNAVAVAVEGDTEFSLFATHGRLQVAQILHHGGIGVMVRERAVGLAEQRDDVGAQELERVHRDDARDAVAAVHHDLDLAGQRAVALHDRVPIARQDRAVLTAPATGAAGGASLFDETSEILDVRAGNCVAAEDALEAVELGRIVRAGHLDAAVHVEHVGREVERRRRQLAHVHAVAAHGLDAREQAVREPRPGGAVVPADGEPRRAPQPLPAERRDGLADGASDLRRELVAHDAADVILAKDGGGGDGGVDEGGAGAVTAGTACNPSPLDFARSSRRFGRMPRKSKPATDTATTAPPSRPICIPEWACSNGSGCMYIAMITGR